MILNYKKFGDSGSTIIILHGLLGSLDNWQTIAKQLATHHQVYILDQRNHGRSPHTTEMSYELLSEDIREFCRQQQIQQTTLIGHSMGGKVAMLFALHHPALIRQLMVVDIAPVSYEGGHESILFAMAEAPLKSAARREDIDTFLQPRIQNFAERQFILKNLARNENGQFEWKCNLEALIRNYRFLMGFTALQQTFGGETFFIKGSDSDYINTHNWKDCLTYFPYATLITVPNAGHWVHAENPGDFIKEIASVLK